MTVEKIRKHGEYLGYCPIKGDIYSIEIAYMRYAIVSIEEDVVSALITYDAEFNR